MIAYLSLFYINSLLTKAQCDDEFIWFLLCVLASVFALFAAGIFDDKKLVCRQNVKINRVDNPTPLKHGGLKDGLGFQNNNNKVNLI